MLLGTIQGKITTNAFSFEAKEEPRNFDYVQIYHQVYDYVLCQITEITKQGGKTTASCQIIGYKDDKGRIKRPRIPFDEGAEVLKAEDDFIKTIISIPEAEDEKTPYAVLGKLDGKDIPVAIDLNTILTKHVAVLAKSGAGKSYTVGVLLEEITERGVPLVVIDPHGEYASLAHANDDKEQQEQLATFGTKARSYNVSEYADININPKAKPLLLPSRLTAAELTHLLPGKLSANQQAILYSALKNLKDVTFDNLLFELEAEESPAKYNIISTIDYLRGLPIFSSSPTPYNELVKSGQATVINLKGINPDVQEIIVYKLAKDLFHLRKQNKIPPFFMVIEEAHNYCPERSFGETKASKILRDIASEGRKFGLGLCVVSQRPARVDKSILSQCSTQILLKVTNPNDLRALAASVEGLTSEAEAEIKHLPIGTALVTGVTDVPLFVNIRPRKTMHGGDAVDVLGSANLVEEKENMLDAVDEFNDQELLALIKPTITPKDLEVMSETPVHIATELLPCYQLHCKEGEQTYKLLVEAQTGAIITNKDELTMKKLPRLEKFAPRELALLQALFGKGTLGKQTLASAIGGSINIDEELKNLLEEEYITLDESNVTISDNYIFTKLHKVASYDDIAYEQLAYDEKGEKRLTIDDIKELYEKFTNIIDHNECYLINYKPLQ